jgi:hypothetical protein
MPAPDTASGKNCNGRVPEASFPVQGADCYDWGMKNRLSPSQAVSA